MKNIIKLHSMGFAIQRAGFVRGGYASYAAFCLMGDNEEVCGLLRVSLSSDLSDWSPEGSGVSGLMDDLFHDADWQDDDCVEVVNAMRQEINTPAFLEPFLNRSHWTHIDYCFIEEQHRGRGLGALFVLAWIEMYASEHFVTATPELARPGLVKYWHENAGFKPISASSPNGPAFRVCGDEQRVARRYVRMINSSLTSHKEAICEGNA